MDNVELSKKVIQQIEEFKLSNKYPEITVYGLIPSNTKILAKGLEIGGLFRDPKKEPYNETPSLRIPVNEEGAYCLGGITQLIERFSDTYGYWWLAGGAPSTSHLSHQREVYLVNARLLAFLS